MGLFFINEKFLCGQEESPIQILSEKMVVLWRFPKASQLKVRLGVWQNVGPVRKQFCWFSFQMRKMRWERWGEKDEMRKQFCWFRTFANPHSLSQKLANYDPSPGLLWHHLCTLKRSITLLSGKLPSHDVVTEPTYFLSKVQSNLIVRMSVSITIV